MFATVRRMTATRDDLGDSTSAAAEQTVPVLQFEPKQAVERTDSRSAGVTAPAKLYFAVPLQLDSDDEVDFDGATWRVVGSSSVWAGTHTEVPVERTGAV